MNHIADVRKKVLSPEQTRALAEMYAERGGWKYYPKPPKSTLPGHYTRTDENGEKHGEHIPDFNDRNNIMELLERKQDSMPGMLFTINRSPCTGFKFAQTYMVSIEIRGGSDIPDRFMGLHPSLPIAIAEALTKMKEN